MTNLLLVCLLLIGPIMSAQPPSAPVAQIKVSLEIIRFNWRPISSKGNLETGYGASNPKSQTTAQIDRQLETLRQHTPENKDAINDLEFKKRQQSSAIKSAHSRAEGKATYQYNLEVKNTAAQPIVEIVWEYVFTDPKMQQEMRRYSFVSKAKIKPGSTKKISVTTTQAPYQVLDASGTGKSEYVSCRQIKYADGSVWKA